MTRDALNGDRLIGMALLKPCSQEQYLTLQAPIHSAVGVGRIVRVEHLADGRFNFVLQGVERVLVQSEITTGPYRRAQCRRILTRDPEPGQACRILRDLKQHLATPGLQSYPPLAKMQSFLDCCTLSLAEKLDMVASIVVTSCEAKQQILSLSCLASRADLVFAAMKRIEEECKTPRRPAPVLRPRSRDCWN